jgi:hypothetical protein
MTDADRQKSPGRKIPPLVWIVIAILVGIVLYAAMTYGGSRTTPSGGTVEQAKPEASLPPDGKAPAP